MSKKLSFSIVVIILAAMGIGLISTTEGYAQEESENKVVRFFKNVFNWPFGVTKESAEAVGRTTKRATDTVITTGSSAVDTVTGKPEKIQDVVVEPIKGSAETAYTAVEGSVKAPIEGTKESFE
ncbi:MAG: hypothetical protein HQ572_02165 [Candidatus Omnitrophica bacterium]|nr:hypothetical protein [Candidatus Omnitrophota bacterium]